MSGEASRARSVTPLRYSVASATWQSVTRGFGSLKISISSRASSETCREIFARRLSMCSRISSLTGTFRPLMSTCIRSSLRRFLPQEQCYARGWRLSITCPPPRGRAAPRLALALGELAGEPEALVGARPGADNRGGGVRWRVCGSLAIGAGGSARREGRAGGAGGGVRRGDRACPRGADLAARLARGPAVLHAHAPTRAPARPRPDPRDPGAHAGAAAAADALDQRVRAARGDARAPGVRGGALRGGDLGVAHPGGIRRRPAPRGGAPARAHHLPARGLAVLVAPPLA